MDLFSPKDKECVPDKMTTPLKPNPHGNNCVCSICVPRDDDAAYSAYLTELHNFQDRHGIKIVSWSLNDGDSDDPFPIARFAEKHPFHNAKWVVNHNCPTKTKIEGDTWLDILKACDKMKQKNNDYHDFIEIITQKGSILEIFCGS